MELSRALHHREWAVERFADEARHMIVFDLLPQGDNSTFEDENIRLYLSDAAYKMALHLEKQGRIKIQKHALVIEGNIVYPKTK